MRPGIIRWLGGLLASVLLVAAISGLLVLLKPLLLPLRTVYILAVVPVAIVWGTGLAALTAVLSAVAFDYLFIPPAYSFKIADSQNTAALGVFLITAVIVGGLAAQMRRAAVESGRLSQEQAALRRVATLVARAAPPPELFSAVAHELAEQFGATITAVVRYEDDGTATIVGGWAEPGIQIPVGTRLTVAGHGVAASVRHTDAAARTEHFDGPPGSVARFFQDAGATTGTGSPVTVEGHLWGVAVVASPNAAAFPSGSERRIADFTELVAIAIGNAQARVELRGFAEEQAALRRVATLVARAAPPKEVFAAVAAEAGRLLGADYTVLSRYEPDGAMTVIGGWANSASARPVPVGIRLNLQGRNVNSMVFQTGRPARIDDYADVHDATGQAADVAREWGFRSAVGVPISVQGHSWGVVSVASTGEPLPTGTEARLEGFTELTAAAIANAEAQEALAASRARLVAASDHARRRIERNLHDGAQQRLVSLALELRAAQAAAPSGAWELAQRLDQVVAGLDGALEELREIARGLHPTALAEGGLRPALKALARRSAVPVRLDIRADQRLPEPVELAAYYVISEALTNTAKHAHATAADVELDVDEGVLRLCVRDDGRGGADFGHGSGLVGLKDRVEALGGQFSLHSPPEMGTTLRAELLLTSTHGDAPA
jgi:signal transduction histidine kinase